jgi:16S rRNA processing protein RimM
MHYFKIGKLVATYGVKGELVLKHSLGKKTALKNLEAIYIEEKQDAFIPYFIQSAKIKNAEEVYIKLEGIDSRESAHILTPKAAWLPEEDFKRFAATTAPIAMLGFTMVNEDQELGEILEVIEQPHQLLCKISFKGIDVLIPIHEASLKKIDKKSRKVFVTLPDGLLDIYTDPLKEKD